MKTREIYFLSKLSKQEEAYGWPEAKQEELCLKRIELLLSVYLRHEVRHTSI